MALLTGTVTGRFEDTTPGVENITGSVYFTAEADYLLSADSVVLPKPVKVDLVGSAFTVSLVATDDPTLNPVDWTYKVTFSLMADGVNVKREPFSIKVPAGTTVNLATVSPVAASEGNAVVRGLQGIQGIQGLTGPQGIQGIQGIQGVKGDPGGWVASTGLATGTILTDVITPGLYLNPQANAANGPSNSTNGGHLEVIAVAGYIYQRYTPIAEARETYVRYRTSGNVWSAWSVFTSTRVDQTAGRVIYQWDDVNNREQMIYGDTGDRAINLSHGNGTFAALKIRRTGNVVHLVCINWVPPTNGASPLSAGLPIGYRNNNTHHFVAIDNGSTLRASNLSASGSGLSVGGNTTASSISFYITYTTLDAWPTSLIGAAGDGGISNL